MERTLFDADTVLVNLQETTPRNDKVFAILVDGELRVKRLTPFAPSQNRTKTAPTTINQYLTVAAHRGGFLLRKWRLLQFVARIFRNIFRFLCIYL